MEALPPIQYARTPDGFNIAFYKGGAGPPVVLLRPHPSSHLALEWRVPVLQESYAWLAQRATLVRLDLRGSGLSDRNVSYLSLEAILFDIQSVLRRLNFDRVGILASGGFSGIYALALAANFPELVSRIVCVDISVGDSDLNRAITELRVVSPAVHARVRGSVMTGVLGSENAAGLTAIYNEATTPESHKAFIDLTRRTDIRPLLTRVEAPTLFMHTAGNEIYPLALAQALIADMPRASLYIRARDSAPSSLSNDQELRLATEFLLDVDDGAVQKSAPDSADSLSADSSAPRPDGLSMREIEVLRLIAQGRTNQEIADDLVISRSTVSHHLTNIFGKTSSSNRTEAAGYAHRHGLI